MTVMGRIRGRLGRRRRQDLAEAPTPVQLALESLLSTRSTLSIVQVGANDGRVNDPINAFVHSHPDRTRLLLIEPQSQILPMLETTYADHPEATVICCAIGEPGELVLWQVAEKYWEVTQPTYASRSGWPTYRAPSGVTSSSRQHVAAWLTENYVGELSTDELLRSFRVPCRPLLEVLESSGFGTTIDLLQIDTEGADDAVIMNSSVEILRPALINFENAHLSPERLIGLTAHLEANGYSIEHHRQDSLATLTTP